MRNRRIKEQDDLHKDKTCWSCPVSDLQGFCCIVCMAIFFAFFQLFNLWPNDGVQNRTLIQGCEGSLLNNLLCGMHKFKKKILSNYFISVFTSDFVSGEHWRGRRLSLARCPSSGFRCLRTGTCSKIILTPRPTSKKTNKIRMLVYGQKYLKEAPNTI